MVDASGLVARVIAPYRAAIDGVLRDVSGDPAAIRGAGARYRAGAATSTRVAATVTTTSSALTGAWQGVAREACAGACRDLTGRLDHVRGTLDRQAGAMARVADAQLRARAGAEQAGRGLATVGGRLLAASRSVPPAAVQPLLTQANSFGAAFHRAATSYRGMLAKVLSETAAGLTAATPAQRRRPAPPAPRQDPWVGQPEGAHGGRGNSAYVVYRDEVRVGGSRAWRNNNPGNLTGGDRSRRLGATGHDGRFAIFPDRATGEAAQRALIQEQWSNETVRDMFYGRTHVVQGRRGPRVVVDLPGYAPPAENNTARYLQYLRDQTGIDTDRTRVNQLTPAQLDAMTRAMHTYEGVYREGRVIRRSP